MFTSDEWKQTRSVRTRDKNLVENVVLDKEFSKSIIICLKCAFPIMQVLRMIDSDDKPTMGFIYKVMDRVKEKIQEEFNGDKKI